MSKHIVAVYIVNQSYGGPEEGGWYYKSGRLQSIEGTYNTIEEANAECSRVQKRLDADENKGRHPLWSVLSDGRCEAQVHKDSAPKYFPEERPRYE